MGSAGPLEEEAEEPQTLEQQHPERQTKRQRDKRAMEVADREKDNDERRANITEEIKSRMEKEKDNKKLVSERNSAGSIAEQLIYTFLISAAFYKLG